MDRTPNLDLPYILPSQAQKHVTHNEAIRALDAVVQLTVADRDLTVPPAAPDDGNRFIVAASASGDWTGRDGEIAAWQDGAWVFFAPTEGWLAWIADEDAIVAWDGSAWTIAGGKKGAFDWIGVGGAAADATNRIASAAAATLLNHAGNGHQLKINKAAAGDTASVLFQTGFSGRAEFGLAGDDDWHVKVSPDGSTWHEAVVVDGTTGNVGLGGSPEATLHVINTGGPIGRFDAYAGASNTRWRRANGTLLSPSAVVADDVIGNFGFAGYDGTDFSNSAGAIKVVAAENWSASAWGAYLTVHTTANGGTTQEERLRITASGDVGVGTNDPSTRLDVDGPVRVKSYTVAGAPSASGIAGAVIFVSDESGGPVIAFSDGTDWRRATDRAVVS
ncbi:MAG: DUF2793 domain-containing protein [Rhizobiaceae bacterium]